MCLCELANAAGCRGAVGRISWRFETRFGSPLLVSFNPLGKSAITWRVAKNAGETLAEIQNGTLSLWSHAQGGRMNARWSSRPVATTLPSALDVIAERFIVFLNSVSIRSVLSVSFRKTSEIGSALR